MTPDTSTLSIKQNKWLTLPDETWLAVLVECSYFDLHRVEGVCKKLKGLVQDKSLDAVLFRQKPFDAESLKTVKHVELHPLVDEMYFTDVRRNEAPTEGYDGGVNAFDYPKVIDEFCSRPTRTSIFLNLNAGEFKVVDPSGITNRKLLTAIGEHWEDAWDFLVDKNGWAGMDVYLLEDGSLYFEAGPYDS